MLHPSQLTTTDLGDRNWWRWKATSLAWFNANIMPHGWDEKFHDFGMIQREMCEHLDPSLNINPQIYLSAFRGSHKSTQLHGLICHFLAWNLAKKKSNSLVYNTATKDNAFNMSADVKHSLLHNEVLQWVFPELPREENAFDDMTQKRIQHRQVKLDFASLETTMVSRHYPVWLNDDLENDENAKTEYMREELKKKWKYQKAVLTKIKSRGIGLEYEIGTPYSVNGLTWMIRNLGRYAKLEIPCYINRDPKQGVTFPELYSVEDFEAKREEMGGSIFSAQYLLKPISEEDALCPEHWLRKWNRLPDVRWRSMVIDPGGSSPGRSDATGITICDTDENGVIYIVFADEFFVTPEELLELIRNLKNQYDPDDMRIEKVAYSVTVADIWAHKYPDMNISFVEHKGRRKGWSRGTSANMDDSRIWRLKQWFETRRILVGPNMPAFEKQLLEYPDSTRDDMLDSLAYQLDIRRIPKRKGKIFLPSGREFEPTVEETFEKEMDTYYERKAERVEERNLDASF